MSKKKKKTELDKLLDEISKEHIKRLMKIKKKQDKKDKIARNKNKKKK